MCEHDDPFIQVSSVRMKGTAWAVWDCRGKGCIIHARHIKFERKAYYTSACALARKHQGKTGGLRCNIRLSVASIGVMERIPHTLEQEVP